MSLIVVVLGMHRSGTSCLMRALHQGGLYLGTEVRNSTCNDNLEGHFESAEAVAINDKILELSGGSWCKIPEFLTSDDDTQLRIHCFLEQLAKHKVAGWKDPRTTVTFPLWKPHLSGYHIVASVRHPVSVARSLQVREGMTLEEGLGLWADYNQRLLEYVKGERNVSWVDYDASPEAREKTLRELCRCLGLQIDEKVLEVFNPYLRHHSPAELPQDPGINSLYECIQQQIQDGKRNYENAREVQEKDGKYPGATESVPPLPSALPAGDCFQEGSDLAVQLDHMHRKCEDLQVRLEQLAKVVHLQNEVQQKQHQLQNRLHREVLDYERRVADCHGLVSRIRRSPVFRLAKAVAQMLPFVAPPVRVVGIQAEPGKAQRKGNERANSSQEQCPRSIEKPGERRTEVK